MTSVPLPPPPPPNSIGEPIANAPAEGYLSPSGADDKPRGLTPRQEQAILDLLSQSERRSAVPVTLKIIVTIVLVGVLIYYWKLVLFILLLFIGPFLLPSRRRGLIGLFLLPSRRRGRIGLFYLIERICYCVVMLSRLAQHRRKGPLGYCKETPKEPFLDDENQNATEQAEAKNFIMHNQL